MILTWKKTASEMQLASGGGYTYSIFRPGGDSGYWTLGRTHAEDGIMETLGTKFYSVEDAQAFAETDYEAEEDAKKLNE